ADIYGPERKNARGLDLTDPLTLNRLAAEMDAASRQGWSAAPLIGGVAQTGPSRELRDPADNRRVIGSVVEADAAHCEQALARAARVAASWDERDAASRATILERAADLYEAHSAALMALIVREGGRTVPDALSELREAVDF